MSDGAESGKGPFNIALIVVLVVAGVISFGLLLSGFAYGGGEASARSGVRGTALSSSAIGFRGLYQLAARFEETAYVRRDEDLATPDLLVVVLEQGVEEAALRRLLNRRSNLPTLVILPKWNVVPDRENPGRVFSRGTGAAPALPRQIAGDLRLDTIRPPDALPPRISGTGLLDGLAATTPQVPQVLSGRTVEPLVELDRRGALIARIGDQPLFVVADPDLLNNQGLANRDNAVLAIRMLRRMMPDDSRRIAFDLTMNGVGGGRSLIRTMLEPPFLALTLALMLAAMIAGYHGAIRFGPVRRGRRAIPFGKAALVENSAALVRMSGREARVGQDYADVVRDEAARVTAAPPTLQGAALDAYLDRFGRRDQPPFSFLAARMREAMDRGAMMRAARALFQWKKDMIR